MGQHFQKALKFLAEGDIEGAQRVDAELEQLASEIEGDRILIGEMIERAKGDQPASKKLNLKKRKFPGRVERSAAIKKAAEQIAKANSGKTNTDDVAKAIEASGYDLDTDVPGTMIGNVLNKDVRWKRLERGIFELVD